MWQTDEGKNGASINPSMTDGFLEWYILYVYVLAILKLFQFSGTLRFSDIYILMTWLIQKSRAKLKVKR